MNLHHFPALNASLNTATTCLLVLGYFLIRRERKLAHIACMTAALATSTLFLACYLYYHAHVGSVKFTAQGFIRPVYFTLLISHTVLAVVVLPLVVFTVVPAVRARYEAHRRLARVTFPVWLYVSVSGVLIYFMLYHWFPPA